MVWIHLLLDPIFFITFLFWLYVSFLQVKICTRRQCIQVTNRLKDNIEAAWYSGAVYSIWCSSSNTVPIYIQGLPALNGFFCHSLHNFDRLCLFQDHQWVNLLSWWIVKEEAYGWDIIHGNASFLVFPCTNSTLNQSFSRFFPIWCWRNNLDCFLIGNNIP